MQDDERRTGATKFTDDERKSGRHEDNKNDKLNKKPSGSMHFPCRRACILKPGG